MENKTNPLEFWSNIWQEGQIRFHQKEYNSQMVEYFKDIDLKNKTVFIPLAGKSIDILFFLEKGAIVTAVEFYEEAVVSFFKENNIPFTKDGITYKSHNLTFLACDFFNFKAEKPFDVLYDRASQVVFTASERPKYYQHISTLINEQTLPLIFSFDHDGPEDYGPPHKISTEEIMENYKKMGHELTLFSKLKEEPSAKMKSFGISEFYSIVLSARL